MGHASLEVGSSMPCIVIRLPWGAMAGPGGKALGALNACLVVGSSPAGAGTGQANSSFPEGP